MESKQNPLPVLDFGKVIGKHVPDTFTWNSISKRIIYLPIATSSNTFFGTAQPVCVAENYCWIVDHKTSTIFQIDKKGNILNSFCRRGQGPGEYGMISYVHVNEQDSTIQVIDQRGKKYNIYDWGGRFIRDFSLKDKNIDLPLLISDNYIVARGQENIVHKLLVMDKELNIEKTLFPTDTTLTDMERLCLSWQVNFCRNRDQTIVHYADEDTVFSVTQNEIRPLCLIDKGAYKLPFDMAKKSLPTLLIFGVCGSLLFRTIIWRHIYVKMLFMMKFGVNRVTKSYHVSPIKIENSVCLSVFQQEKKYALIQEPCMLRGVLLQLP